MEVKLPNFHDYALVAVDSSKLPALTLTLRGNNDTKCLHCYGVELFRFSDYIYQNIISRLLCTPIDRQDEAEIKKSVIRASSLSDTSSLIRSDAIDKYVSRITNQELHLLILEPSWGAEGIIVCKSCQVEDNPS
jgi:hypothetical protein